jgi:predicted GNAT superfamily acetyltransferase
MTLTGTAAGVTVHELRSPAELARGADLLREVWHDLEMLVPASLLCTVQRTGGYVFGAYDDLGALLGVSVGLLAAHGLHSHVTGVRPSARRRGLGFALKQHQRHWSLERGITRITWTCDPLVRRNMAFNLHALGATVQAYVPNLYGPMNDAVNRGDETDRLEILWGLTSPRVSKATTQRLPWRSPDLPAGLTCGAGSQPVEHHVDGVAQLVHLPADIEMLRRTDPGAAQAWRHAVRDVVVAALARGAGITGMTESGALVIEECS